MTARELVDKALDYRDGNTVYGRDYARFDLLAALEHAPNCSNCEHRFGNDRALLVEAIALLG